MKALSMADYDRLSAGGGLVPVFREIPGDLRTPVRVDRIDASSVAAVRARMGFSQARFAKLLGISVDTVQNWEQGRRKPTGAAKVLLRIAATNPEIVLQAVA